MKQSELRPLLRAAYDKQFSRALQTAARDHPQVVATHNEPITAAKTSMAVLDAWMRRDH